MAISESSSQPLYDSISHKPRVIWMGNGTMDHSQNPSNPSCPPPWPDDVPGAPPLQLPYHCYPPQPHAPYFGQTSTVTIAVTTPSHGYCIAAHHHGQPKPTPWQSPPHAHCPGQTNMPGTLYLTTASNHHPMPPHPG